MFVCRLDESSVAGHMGERRVRVRGDNDTEAGSVAAPGDVGELSDVVSQMPCLKMPLFLIALKSLGQTLIFRTHLLTLEITRVAAWS